MVNLTIQVDEKMLEKARVRASAEGTTVDEILKKHLDEYAAAREAQIRAIHHALEIGARARASSSGRRWTREDLYDR